MLTQRVMDRELMNERTPSPSPRNWVAMLVEPADRARVVEASPTGATAAAAA